MKIKAQIIKKAENARRPDNKELVSAYSLGLFRTDNTERKMIKFECCHADTCLSGYWSGHHLPHVQIPVYRGMTLAQVKSALHDELSNRYVAGSGELACAFDYDMSTDKERTEELYKAAHDAIDAIELKDPENDHCFMDVEEIDENDDWCESVYAFFVFVELEDE